MKLKFKKQEFQTKAVEAVIDCFKGQPFSQGLGYLMDPGVNRFHPDQYSMTSVNEMEGFKNSDLLITEAQLLENIQAVQRAQNINQSSELSVSRISRINLDIEMETGTGKTYCYIKSIFEMNRRFGWSKFIIVVPSIAIREGVYKSLEITADHFQEEYHKKAKFFIYNSKQLHNLESYSSDYGINIMVINVQAFNARGKDNRRIYEELDEFQSRKPIDVIKANRPILILDEPQKMEGDATLQSLVEFNPLMILRYSATHKKTHNIVYRLDALDAYNQKLVKKIAVRGISVKGLSGTSAYLYLQSIEVSKQAPTAKIELEVKQKSGLKKITRVVKKGDNLHILSKELDQYKDYVVNEINAISNTLTFTNGVELVSGEAVGDVNEATLRRIQIREAISAHLEKERVLYGRGIKVLSLFFIDEVSKYRVYSEAGEEGGDYAKAFEEEYQSCLENFKDSNSLHPEYLSYLNRDSVASIHNGYFSIDKKSKRLIDPSTKSSSSETDDVDAYDLILKDKERLLSFSESTRFIFSHSALREGWDNPNVFVICALKHANYSNKTPLRQEIGRGLRLSVDQNGDRQDHPSTVHDINVLTVVAADSYKSIVSTLQEEYVNALEARPRIADQDYFLGKSIKVDGQEIEINAQMAKAIYKYLLKQDYIDDNDRISDAYHEAKKSGALEELPAEIKQYSDQIFQLIDSVYSDADLPEFENDRDKKTNPLNDNFQKKEFKELWARINKKAVYSVHFDSSELIEKAIQKLNKELIVSPLSYTVHRGEQKDDIKYHELESGEGFRLGESETKFETNSIRSTVKYDLIGKLSEEAKLTRRTVSKILTGLKPETFDKFKINPEQFILEASRLIKEQKATMVIEHLSYDMLEETYDNQIFTDAQSNQNFSKVGEKLKRHIYDYIVTDSENERTFVNELDKAIEVVVYAKLPKGFHIPTPVGEYNPDWAIAFQDGKVKHVYFVAETKGSMLSMQLREIEQSKIECAHKFFEKIETENVKYRVIKDFGNLMELVR
jgi:type III restriction enzyme